MDWLVDRVFPFRRLTVWLGALVLGVSALALILSVLLVLPSLDQGLVDQRVAGIAASAESTGPTFADNFAAALGSGREEDVVVAYGALTDSLVTVYEAPGDGTLQVVASMDEPGPSPVAAAALTAPGVQAGVTGRRPDRVAEAAFALRVDDGRYIVLLREPLDDVDAAVDLTWRRSLLGALIALPLAVLVGALAAALLTRRIRRLERASTRIAEGNLAAPIEDRGRDEIGQLAVSLDRMRGELERVDAARRAFVSNASHELRTPVFALSGYLELLLEEEDPATRQRFLGVMQDQIDRLTRLATDLLDLSRLDAGRIPVEREPVELAAVAEGVVRDLGPAAAKRSAVLRAEAAPAMALADETRIGQVARILVDNALRHNPEGVEVVVRTVAADGTAALVVEDSGPPIAAGEERAVFARFSRGTGAGEGSGLGLAIASELAERMGGRLVLDQTGPRKAFRVELAADPDAAVR